MTENDMIDPVVYAGNHDQMRTFADVRDAAIVWYMLVTFCLMPSGRLSARAPASLRQVTRSAHCSHTPRCRTGLRLGQIRRSAARLMLTSGSMVATDPGSMPDLSLGSLVRRPHEGTP